MTAKIYTEFADDLIKLYDESGDFDLWLSFKLIQRSLGSGFITNR